VLSVIQKPYFESLSVLKFLRSLIQLQADGLEPSREVWIQVKYKERVVGRKRVDFVVEGVMLEIKAKAQWEPVDFVQALSYLKASGSKVGLLINFGGKELQIKRLAN
jgi:GxxExxY protein